MIKASSDISGLKSDVYNALADVAYEYRRASKEDMQEAVDWFMAKFYEGVYRIQIVLREAGDDLGPDDKLTKADAEMMKDDVVYIVENQTPYEITTSSASLDDDFTVRVVLGVDSPMLPRTARRVQEEIEQLYTEMIVSVDIE